jgi:hypothetical protein
MVVAVMVVAVTVVAEGILVLHMLVVAEGILVAHVSAAVASALHG